MTGACTRRHPLGTRGGGGALAGFLGLVGLSLTGLLVLGVPAAAQPTPTPAPAFDPDEFTAWCDVELLPVAQVIACEVDGAPDATTVRLIVRSDPQAGSPTWSGAQVSLGEPVRVQASVDCGITGPVTADVTVDDASPRLAHRQTFSLLGDCPDGVTVAQALRLCAVGLVAVTLVLVPTRVRRHVRATRRRRFSGTRRGRSGARARAAVPPRSRRTSTRRR